MPETVIRSENLSKRFIITQRSQRDSGELFVDLMMNRARSALGKLTRLGQSKPPEKSSRYEEFWALKDVNFEIKAGELVSIIGHNGAGKTTLIKVLSRITEPTEGRVEIFGRVNSLLEVGTGFHPELTGRENIFLNGAILGMTRVEMRRKFDEIVAFAGVDRFIDTPVKRYSTGMYVRLAFAVAAHLEAEILVVDEVLAVGDAEFQAKCLNRMSEVASSGRTVLFVSHNFAAITALTKRGIVLNQGRVTFDGAVDGALAHYTAGLGRKTQTRTWGRGLNSALLAAELIDEQGQPTERYVAGKPLRLRVQFETMGLPGLSLDAVLRDNHNIAVAHYASNNFSQVLLPAEAGRYECVLSLDPYWLASGEYGLDLMITVPNIMDDHKIDNAVRFTVDTCSPNGSSFNFSQDIGYGNLAMQLSAPLRFTPLPRTTS
jgi:lipopolysaccharide transport system ATP-binding protein